MYIFFHSEMLDAHVTDKKALEKLNSSKEHRNMFDFLLLGKNIVSLDVIDDIARYLCRFNEDELIKITWDNLIEAVGEYIDESGSLV